MLPAAVQECVNRCSDRAAIRVSEHDEEWRAQMVASVLQASRDFRGHNVPRNTNNEQLAKTGIEDQLGRDPRIATA